MSKLIKIGNKRIGRSQPVFIIAEGGVNHNSQLDLALKLIDKAAECGADAIKFQTWRAEQLVTKTASMADYQKKNTKGEGSQYDMLKKLELKEEWYPALLKQAKDKGIILLSAPHGGFEAVDLMEFYDFPAFKFPSGDITNLPLLEYAAKLGKPMLISSGMSSMEEVEQAVGIVQKAGNDQVLIFHCTTDYPVAEENVNLLAIKTIKDKLDVLVGYSDHTLGDQVPIMAVDLGACMIEKHFTLDRSMSGPDHIASTEPKEFKEMVKKLKQMPKILGSGIKKPQEVEKQYIIVSRKSIIVCRDIKKGEKLTKENLTIKRPGNGILPKFYPLLLGKTVNQDIPADTLLTEGMIKP